MGILKFGDRLVGTGSPCYIIAEIGINHNGSLEYAKQLIDIAANAGCQAVKFQKRDVETVYTDVELRTPRSVDPSFIRHAVERSCIGGVRRARSALREPWDSLVRVRLGRTQCTLRERVRRSVSQDRFGVSHARRLAPARSFESEAGHPVDGWLHDGASSSRNRGSWNQRSCALALCGNVSVQGRGHQPRDDRNTPYGVSESADRVLGPRAGYFAVSRCRIHGRVRGRAAHYARSKHAGFGSASIGRSDRARRTGS